PGPQRALLDVRARLEDARVEWLGRGSGGAEVLRSVFDDVVRLGEELDLPAALRREIAATLAGVPYQPGDPATGGEGKGRMGKAIDWLLLAEGAVLDAASLLNEQAALSLRQDDVAGAEHQLLQSKALLEGRLRQAPLDGDARIELADAAHLLARLPLYQT